MECTIHAAVWRPRPGERGQGCVLRRIIEPIVRLTDNLYSEMRNRDLPDTDVDQLDTKRPFRDILNSVYTGEKINGLDIPLSDGDLTPLPGYRSALFHMGYVSVRLNCFILVHWLPIRSPSTTMIALRTPTTHQNHCPTFHGV